MTTRAPSVFQRVLRDGWHEWPTVSLIFLGLVVLAATLLMTRLPKPLVLWGSFVAGLLLPALGLAWREHRRRQGGCLGPHGRQEGSCRCHS